MAEQTKNANPNELIARDAAHKIEDLLRAGWRDVPEQNVTNIILDALAMVQNEESDNAGCDKCGVYDRVPGSKYCAGCGKEAKP